MTNLAKASGGNTGLQTVLEHLREERSKDNGEGLTDENLSALALSVWTWATSLAPGKRDIRMLRGPDTVLGDPLASLLEIAGPDSPFLVDSVMAECTAQGFEARAIFHPVVPDEREGFRSIIQVHLHAVTPPEGERLVASLKATLADLDTVVSDHKAMRARMREERERLAAITHIDREDRDEAVAFLDWLAHEHFVFLGARTYSFEIDASGDFLREEPTMIAGSNLGLLRNEEMNVLTRGAEPTVRMSAAQEFLQLPEPLIIAKSTYVSHIHRRVRADYIGVKRYDGTGRVNGETRFLGLFTSEAYNETARTVPLIRRRVAQALEKLGARTGGHTANALSNILENWPRDELFQTDVATLAPMAQGVLHIQERPRTRVFLRRDRFDRFLSAIVYVPRDAYDSALRQRIGQVLCEAFDATLLSFEPRFGNERLARVLFQLELKRGHPEPDPVQLERRIATLAARWEDAFRDALLSADLPDHVRDGALCFENAFNAAYRDVFVPQEAIADVAELAELGAAAPVRMRVYRQEGDASHTIRAKVYSRGKEIALSESVPVFENMGLFVNFETGYRVRPARKPREDAPDTYWIHDLFMCTRGGQAIDIATVGPRFEDAFVAVWMKRAENDGFNRLVFALGATWQEADLLRALSACRRQSGMDPAAPSQIRALTAHPAIARGLVALFHALFDPAPGDSPPERKAAAMAIRAHIREELAQVPSLEDDRVLRRLCNLVMAIQRTNFYQRGRTCPLAFKVASRELEDLPKPKPFREIFVAGPVVEGVHLRFGAVARGGLRWSDRPDDFRTEVLGLVKAQQVKNAVIVPVGSKGGFCPKQVPAGGSREAVRDAGIEAYRAFVSALLSVTDNLVDGEVRHPEDTVVHDGADPYLVVAADKGTATFSDIANEISVSQGFWLGDAFASGGSAGYDHKAMGITARGAWEAVKRHFLEVGKDIQSEAFDVIGIGDMSGDVFGNGMLLSKHIRLLAAFNHMHVFVDPDPADTESAWAERDRMFKLPRSTWADYDASLISRGGGVFARSAKAITLTPEIKALSGLSADEATPDELIHAILKAETDLLWFGGIGTYVKAPSETHAGVGDRANDAIRVDATDLRAKVIGEGANLAITQAGRISFAAKGGRINTDAIDNSAGVDSSDHEVNIKILLSEAMRRGALPRGERNTLLASMTDEVAEHVLAHNIAQTGALTLAEATVARDHQAFERLMAWLESRGMLDREVEGLPTSEAMSNRAEEKRWLTRPEMSVLLAWSKIALFDDIVASALPDDPVFLPVLEAYFPDALGRYSGIMAAHRLKREIIATVLSNRLLDAGGPVFLLRLRELTGADNAGIVRAFEIARSAARGVELTQALSEAGHSLSALAHTALRLENLAFLEAMTVQVLRGGMDGDTADLIAHYGTGIEALAGTGDTTVSSFGKARAERTVRRLLKAGATEALARKAAGLIFLETAPRLVDVAVATGTKVEATSVAFGRIAEAVQHDRLRSGALDAIPGLSSWDRLATESQMESLVEAQVSVVRQVLEGDGDIAAWLGAREARHDQMLASLKGLEIHRAWSFSKFSLAADTVRRFLSA